MRSVEFLLRLLDHEDHPAVSPEDLDGPHGAIIRAWQKRGFIATEPGINPVPSCPHCEEGIPYSLGGRYLCAACRSTVDMRHLFLWPLLPDSLLRETAARLGLRGEVQMIDPQLWQLGTGEVEGEIVECFYRRQGVLSQAGERRLSAYRRVLLFCGPLAFPRDAGAWTTVPFHDLFDTNGNPGALDLTSLVRPAGAVRFDGASGTLWAGRVRMGEVPLGTREYYFLQCLSEQLDRYVPYEDLKREVQQRGGSTDTRDEATYCQNLKRRLKERYVPEIDRLVVTTNKADGYRLRAGL